MGKNIQISKSLFNALYRYHVLNDRSEESYIRDELASKMSSHVRRVMYSQYKIGKTAEIREQSFEVYKEMQSR